MTAARLATRHACRLRYDRGAGWSTFHTAGNGKPRSQRCTYCHGPLDVQTGLWGVFTWRGDGRYDRETAFGTFASEPAAQRNADKRNEVDAVHVVRWIPVEAQP